MVSLQESIRNILARQPTRSDQSKPTVRCPGRPVRNHIPRSFTPDGDDHLASWAVAASDLYRLAHGYPVPRSER